MCWWSFQSAGTKMREQMRTNSDASGRQTICGRSLRTRLVRSAAVWFLSLASLCRAFGGDGNAAHGLNGQPVDPFLSRPAKATVFFFVRTDCPISNRYAPEMKRLQEQFGAKGIAFWLVYPDSDLSADAVRSHAKEYSLPFPVLLDPSHRLVELCHASVTPEVAVLTPEKKVAYHGRIDDRYTAFGKWRSAATRRDLEEVLTAILDGGVIPPNAPAIGCAILPVK